MNRSHDLHFIKIKITCYEGTFESYKQVILYLYVSFSVIISIKFINKYIGGLFFFFYGEKVREALDSR